FHVNSFDNRLLGAMAGHDRAARGFADFTRTEVEFAGLSGMVPDSSPVTTTEQSSAGIREHFAVRGIASWASPHLGSRSFPSSFKRERGSHALLLRFPSVTAMLYRWVTCGGFLALRGNRQRTS